MAARLRVARADKVRKTRSARDADPCPPASGARGVAGVDTAGCSAFRLRPHRNEDNINDNDRSEVSQLHPWTETFF